MKKETNILLIYTGGTIGMVKDYESGVLKTFNFDKLLERIPELNQLRCTIDSISFDEPIDSSNMNPVYWVSIATSIEENYEQYDGFVVLHGSDTMSYTSSALSFMLENLSKPVIFTGSQLPIGDLRTDAKENLITSIQIASLKENGRPVIQEVGLYFEYKLYRANRTTKINAEHFEAFASLNHPMLGFMGTVIGMIQAFQKIAAVGNLSASLIAGDIQVALLTTVFGLITAISYNGFLGRLNTFICSIQSLIKDGSNRSFCVSTNFFGSFYTS